MPSNVEIKATVLDPGKFAEKSAQLSQSQGIIIRQHDTFFNCSTGRLKLRDFMDGTGQLIFYERPDTDGPKLSRYSISPTSDPSSLRNVLLDALGIKGEVRKERRLFLIGQTRVHLDAVEGLGHYMELESLTYRAEVTSAALPLLCGHKNGSLVQASCGSLKYTAASVFLRDFVSFIEEDQRKSRKQKLREVVMRPEQTVEEGQQIACDLMNQLGVSQESLVTGAYMDLILKGCNK